MTRLEFIEEVHSFDYLISFCRDYEIDYCDDIYDADCVNDYVMDMIKEMRDWTDVYRYLRDIPDNSEYYREDGCGGFEDADHSFADYKSDVLRYMDDNGLWDEEDEDESDDSDQEYTTGLDNDDEEIESYSFMTILRG